MLRRIHSFLSPLIIFSLAQLSRAETAVYALFDATWYWATLTYGRPPEDHIKKMTTAFTTCGAQNVSTTPPSPDIQFSNHSVIHDDCAVDGWVDTVSFDCVSLFPQVGEVVSKHFLSCFKNNTWTKEMRKEEDFFAAGEYAAMVLGGLGALALITLCFYACYHDHSNKKTNTSCCTNPCWKIRFFGTRRQYFDLDSQKTGVLPGPSGRAASPGSRRAEIALQELRREADTKPQQFQQ